MMISQTAFGAAKLLGYSLQSGVERRIDLRRPGPALNEQPAQRMNGDLGPVERAFARERGRGIDSIAKIFVDRRPGVLTQHLADIDLLAVNREFHPQAIAGAKRLRAVRSVE